MNDSVDHDIADETWQDLASQNGITADEAEARYRDAVSNADSFTVEDTVKEDPGLAETLSQGECVSRSVTASIWKVISVKAKLNACGPASDWTVSAEMDFKVGGLTVASRSLKFSQNDSQSTVSINAAVLKADFTAGVRSENHCVFISGKFKYFDILRWRGKEVDVTLFCFGKIG